MAKIGIDQIGPINLDITGKNGNTPKGSPRGPQRVKGGRYAANTTRPDTALAAKVRAMNIA